MKSDIIIIGAGPGGYETAVYAASRGLTVTIFEANELGGTCLNRGCIPTKTLCKNVDVINHLKTAEEYGLNGVSYSIDFYKMIERKNSVVTHLRDGVALSLKHQNITLVYGEAEVVSDKSVLCNGETYECDNMIIATGSVPKYLPVEGAHLPNVLTSDEILDLKELPDRLCIIGGGVIGLEFASIFNSLGVIVTVVEFCKEVLPNFDSDIAKRLRQSLVKKGISINVSAGVTEIVDNGDGSTCVKYEQKGKQFDVLCDKVLMAVGRSPRLPNGVDIVGIESSVRGIAVDENMQTNIAGVYAIGDVNARCMLAHAATFQGKRAINAILGKADKIRLDIMPSAVFTSPEVSMVGVTDSYCKDNGIDISIKKSFFRANGKAVAMNETDGILKLIVSNADGKILGCHIMGAHAADLIQEVAALMNCDATVEDLHDMIHAHPTLGEVVLSAAT